MSRVIPIYDGEWNTKEFQTDADFREYLELIFKEPGEYDFTKMALKFNEQARIFNDEGNYCSAPFRSKDLLNIGKTKKTNVEQELYTKMVIMNGI